MIAASAIDLPSIRVRVIALACTDDKLAISRDRLSRAITSSSPEFDDGTIFFQHVEGAGPAQRIDPAIARDCRQPRQERPLRIERRPLGVHRQQRVLDQIIDHIRRNAACEISREPGPRAIEDEAIGGAVAALRQRHGSAELILVAAHPAAGTPAASTGLARRPNKVSIENRPGPRTMITSASATHTLCTGHHASG